MISYNFIRIMPAYMRIAFAAACLFAGSCTKEVKVEKAPEPGYFERTKFLLQGNAGFSTFCYYLRRTGLLDSLGAEGPFTVLAPDDNAFKNLLYPPDTVGTLTQRMRYHILKGKVSLRALPLGMNQELPAADGKKVWVSKWTKGVDTLITVNGCPVSQTDVTTSNGYLNILSDVMELETHTAIEDMLKNDENLTIFSTALNRTGLFDFIRTNKNVTILAPDNNAFRSNGIITSMEQVLTMDLDSLTQLMKHHLMSGRKFMYDIVTDINNGITQFTMLDGTTIRAATLGNSVAWIPKTYWIYPIYNSRVSYPADDAILHRVQGVILLW